MDTSEGRQTQTIVANISRGTVVTYGDIAAEVYGKPGKARAVTETIKKATQDDPDTFPWWRVVNREWRPTQTPPGARERLTAEGVAFTDDGAVAPAHRSSIATEVRMSEQHHELFHYTNLGAFEGVLTSDNLWATHVSHLNDSSEFNLMWEMIVPHLTGYLYEAVEQHPGYSKQIQKTPRSRETYAKAAGLDANTFVEIMRSGIFKHVSPFVACFTTHTEEYDQKHRLLSQWRGYGDDGVAIVFDRKKMEDLLEQEKARFDYLGCTLVEAVYYTDGLDIQKQFPSLFGVLREWAPVAISESLLTQEADRMAGDILKKLAIELFQAVGTLKHQAFKEEREHRIIAGPAKQHHSQISQHPGFKETYFRHGACGSIPYIKLFEGDAALPISKVLVGPSRNQVANRLKVKTMLEHKKRNAQIALEVSEIPFVGPAEFLAI